MTISRSASLVTDPGRESQSKRSGLATLIPLWMESIALVVLALGVWLQYREHQTIQKTELAGLMLELNSLLRDEDILEIHTLLGPNGDWGPGVVGLDDASWNRIRRYMGVLEYLETWRVSNIIDIELIDSSYAGRLATIWHHPEIREHFFEPNPEAWTRMTALLNSIRDLPNFLGKSEDFLTALAANAEGSTSAGLHSLPPLQTAPGINGQEGELGVE